MPALLSDYILSTTGPVAPMGNVFVRMVNNVTGIAYISLSPSTTNGLYSIANIPVGAYTVSTGLTSSGPWVLTGDTSYIVSDSTGVYNVKDYGAKGDGVTDDTTAIQAALDAQRTSSAFGTVYAPPGVYALSMSSRTGGFAGNACALMYGGNLAVVGAGDEATIFRLRNSQSGCTGLGNNLASVFSPWNVNQDQVTFADFTVDGNAANQSDTHSGILVWRQRGVRHHRVRVRDCRGTANGGGAAETFLFYGLASADVTYVDCQAAQTAGTCSNGFVANSLTNFSYDSCYAISIGAGAGIGFGFNAGTSGGASRQGAYVACHAYLCGSRGYHIDDANVKNIRYIGCVSGGTAANNATQYPFTSGQNLGNAGLGYLCAVAATAISYVDCVAEGNGSHGWDLRAGEFELAHCSSNGNAGDGFNHQSSPTIKFISPIAKNNTGSGINIVSAASATNIRITGGPILTGNTVAQLKIGATNYAQPPANVAAPAVPASTVAQTNQFAHDATVHVTGGTVTVIAVNGVATGLIAGTFTVPAGATITITYTVVPTWVWNLV